MCVKVVGCLGGRWDSVGTMVHLIRVCIVVHSPPLPSPPLPSPPLPSPPLPRGEICTLPVGDDSLTHNRDEF